MLSPSPPSLPPISPDSSGGSTTWVGSAPARPPRSLPPLVGSRARGNSLTVGLAVQAEGSPWPSLALPPRRGDALARAHALSRMHGNSLAHGNSLRAPPSGTALLTPRSLPPTLSCLLHCASRTGAPEVSNIVVSRRTRLIAGRWALPPLTCMPHMGWPCLSCPCPAFVGQLAGSLSRMPAESLPRLRIVPAEPVHQWHWHNLASSRQVSRPALSPRSPASPRITPSQSSSPRQLLRFVPPFRSLHVILGCRNPLARIALRSRSLAADLPPPLMVRAPFARSPCFNTVASNIGMRQQYWCAPTAWLASSAPDKLMWPHSRI